MTEKEVQELLNKVKDNMDCINYIIRDYDLNDQDASDVELVLKEADIKYFYDLDTIIRDHIIDGINDYLVSNEEITKDTSLRKAVQIMTPSEYQLDRIRDDISLSQLYDLMKQGKDVYEVASVDGDGFDSDVREKIFTAMSDSLNIDYDDIYNLWLHGDSKMDLDESLFDDEELVEDYKIIYCSTDFTYSQNIYHNDLDYDAELNELSQMSDEDLISVDILGYAHNGDYYIVDTLSDEDKEKVRYVLDTESDWLEESLKRKLVEFSYRVYELDENGDELDCVGEFNNEEKAIKFAKKQDFPTHVGFVPYPDSDEGPEYREYIEMYAPYEEYEIIWTSEDKNESLEGKVVKNNCDSLNKIANKEYGKGKTTHEGNFKFKHKTEDDKEYNIYTKPTNEKENKIKVTDADELKEANNQLKDLAKHNKKAKKGPLMTVNTNCGDNEKNVAFFNHCTGADANATNCAGNACESFDGINYEKVAILNNYFSRHSVEEFIETLIDWADSIGQTKALAEILNSLAERCEDMGYIDESFEQETDDSKYDQEQEAAEKRVREILLKRFPDQKSDIEDYIEGIYGFGDFADYDNMKPSEIISDYKLYKEN